MFPAVSAIVIAAAPIAMEHPAPVQSAIETIHAHHLDTADGRIAFLTEKMPPFTARATQLNQEVQALIQQTQDPANLQNIVHIGGLLGQKMAVLGPMLPILKDATHLDEDFQQIDEVLQKDPPLAENEQEMLLRVAKISAYVANIDLNAAANP